jgi:hypothetical protein
MPTARQFIRHPADVPILIRYEAHATYVQRETKNVSFGGLAFSSDTRIEPDTMVSLRFPYLKPVFEVPTARVAWCESEGSRYAVGVQFVDSEEAYRVRMIEQLCYIESYRKEVGEREGRELTVDEAAFEWIERFGSSFPNP